MNDQEDAYIQGRRDYYHAFDLADNPYDWDSETDLALAWKSGFLSAGEDE